MYPRIIIACCLLFTAALPMAKAEALVGKAYDANSGELLYEEQHTITQQRIRTQYLAPDGKLIATREVTFDQDRVQSYRLTYHQHDRTEQIQRLVDGIAISLKKNQQDNSTVLRTKSNQEVTIDAGFSQFITRNWDRVTTGEKLTTEFVSTERMDLVKIAIRQRDTKLPGDLGVHDLTSFEMTLANPLFSWLLEPVRVAYYSDSQQLAYYHGASNLYRANGNHFGTVRILFERQTSIPLGNAE
ncbi:hypothetical protein GCM10008090_30060 [Arenicella chitinivorans]|uniref:DUF3108 domain-containing protein n=1 Tax=Arenicella chitinivorans TaxID=1329800 RepID=A0A918S0P2_9GAMM|nr:hypothetical protein [Arenicella chitinivorans]GHA18456.1 hypothetical protein GCM10008090_30060 [Arenicella chitinivorans]